jgi:hypothetical protein
MVIVPPLSQDIRNKLRNKTIRSNTFLQNGPLEKAILANRPALAEAIKAGDRETVAAVQRANRTLLNLGW